MLNVIIPIAGKGSRFSEAGYQDPKPFLPIGEMTMLERVIENIEYDHPFRLIIPHRPEHAKRLKEIISRVERRYPEIKTVCVEINKTDGAAQTVRQSLTHWATPLWDDEPVMVVNSDQIIEKETLFDWYKSITNEDHDASILCLNTTDPKYSFAQVVGNEVIRTAEKNPISDIGTVGLYWWKTIKDCQEAIVSMIDRGERFNGEWYLCPSFNYLPRTHKIGYFIAPSEDCWFLGDPDGYEGYLSQRGYKSPLKKERWKPDFGEVYYTIETSQPCSYPEVKRVLNQAMVNDLIRIAHGNCYRTSTEACDVLENIKGLTI